MYYQFFFYTETIIGVFITGVYVIGRTDVAIEAAERAAGNNVAWMGEINDLGIEFPFSAFLLASGERLPMTDGALKVTADMPV